MLTWPQHTSAKLIAMSGNCGDILLTVSCVTWTGRDCCTSPLHCYPQTALTAGSGPFALTAGWDTCAHVSFSPAPYGASPVFLLSDSEEFLCPPSFGFKTHSVKIATKIRWLSSHYCSLNGLLGFVFFPKYNLLVTRSHLQMSVFSLRTTEPKDLGEWSAISL